MLIVLLTSENYASNQNKKTSLLLHLITNEEIMKNTNSTLHVDGLLNKLLEYLRGFVELRHVGQRLELLQRQLFKLPVQSGYSR